MLIDNSCGAGPALGGERCSCACSSANTAPCTGQIELQPVNISCIAVRRPRKTCASGRRRPSYSVTSSGGSVSAGVTGPSRPCADTPVECSNATPATVFSHARRDTWWVDFFMRLPGC